MKEACKSLVNIYHDVFFHGLPAEARVLVGEKAAKVLIIRPMAAAMRKALEKEHIPKEVLEAETLAPKFNFCYNLMADLGFPFEYEVLEDTEDTYVQKVTRCPHIEYTREEPLACFACYGTKKGILDALMNHVEIGIEKRMALGDPYCLFRVNR